MKILSKYYLEKVDWLHLRSFTSHEWVLLAMNFRWQWQLRGMELNDCFRKRLSVCVWHSCFVEVVEIYCFGTTTSFTTLDEYPILPYSLLKCVVCINSFFHLTKVEAFLELVTNNHNYKCFIDFFQYKFS